MSQGERHRGIMQRHENHSLESIREVSERSINSNHQSSRSLRRESEPALSTSSEFDYLQSVISEEPERIVTIDTNPELWQNSSLTLPETALAEEDPKRHSTVGPMKTFTSSSTTDRFQTYNDTNTSTTTTEEMDDSLIMNTNRPARRSSTVAPLKSFNSRGDSFNRVGYNRHSVLGSIHSSMSSERRRMGSNRHSTLSSMRSMNTTGSSSLRSNFASSTRSNPPNSHSHLTNSNSSNNNPRARFDSNDSSDSDVLIGDRPNNDNNNILSKSDRTNTSTDSSLDLNGRPNPPSALRRGPSNRGLSVNFAGDINNAHEPRQSIASIGGNESKFDMSMEGSMDLSFLTGMRGDSNHTTDFRGSEQVFLDPKRRSHHVGFRTQRAESLAGELADLENYLSTLKQSIMASTDKSGGTNDTAVNSNIQPRRPSPEHHKEFYGGMEPKSKRRFSMAYRTDEETVTYPDDCFSFLICNGPFSGKGARFFFFGLGISLLQLGFLILALLSQVSKRWKTTGGTDNPTNSVWFFIPADTGMLVKFAQILAIIAYCLFAEMGMKDYITAIELWPQYNKVTKDDKYWCIVFSCFLRLSMGLLTIAVTLVMLVTNTSVIDTILDFLAMGFISDIGKMAFQLALWGKYGRRLEEEALRLEDSPLPKCMIRPYSRTRYWWITMPISTMAILFLAAILFFQQHDEFFSTQQFRVQFVNNPSLDPYSGCYSAVKGNSWRPNDRDLYLFDSDPNNTIKFGYCFRNKKTKSNVNKWILFNSEQNDPCKATSKETLLVSASTEAYDIAASFFDTWHDKHGTPMDLNFNSDSAILKSCGGPDEPFLNNGHCDDIFNNFDFDYDGGDCCASTCSKSNCGVDALQTVFGTNVTNTNKTGDGFPNCIDPTMYPVTIKLDNIFNSSTFEGELQRQLQLDGDNSTGNGYFARSLWMNEGSINEPIMVLDCDDRNLLTVSINGNMMSQMETVWVQDRANCTMRINNSTSSYNDTPIWYVNYTIYHGNSMAVDNDSIVMVQEQSSTKEITDFIRLPECYIEKLSKHLELSTIYTVASPEQAAVRWLLATSKFTRNDCNDDANDDSFIERYALAVLNFAAPMRSSALQQIDPNYGADGDNSTVSQSLVSFVGNIDIGNYNRNNPEVQKIQEVFYDNYLWIQRMRHCIWPKVGCNGPSVASLDLRRLNLEGTIASSIGMLTSLIKLGLSDNFLEGTIPSHIGNLKSLQRLDFSNNTLSGTIPSEIGEMRELVYLNAEQSGLTGLIPTEIGLLTSLQILDLSDNAFRLTIPNEIGNMTSLVELDLSNNNLTGSIPTELGNLALNYNLKKVFVGDNTALVMMGDPKVGLRGVVYTECVIEGCFPVVFSNDTVRAACQEIEEEYARTQQLLVDDCEQLQTVCRFC